MAAFMGSFSAFLSHSLFSLFILHTCSFKSTFLACVRSTPFTRHTVFSVSSLASISFIQLLPGVRPVRLRVFVGELSPSEGCSESDQPPPEPQLASGNKYRHREPRSWQSRVKTQGETDTRHKEGRSI